MCSPVSKELHALFEYTDICGYLSSSEKGSGHPPFRASHAVPPLLLALQAGITHLRCYRVMLIEVTGLVLLGTHQNSHIESLYHNELGCRAIPCAVSSAHQG